MLHELLQFAGSPPLKFLATVTAVLFLTFQPWSQFEPSGSLSRLLGQLCRTLLLVALCFQILLTSYLFWLCICVLHAWWIYTAYAVADNHRYLEGYWVLALAAAIYVGADKGAIIVQKSSPILIGLCFFWATVWKVLSKTFRTGSFFLSSFFMDPRFHPLAHALGGVDKEALLVHRSAALRVSNGDSGSETVLLPNRLRAVAIGMTWWTIGIELVLSAIFLFPIDGLSTLRAVALCTFAVTTFVVIPVQTFGNVLLILLMASSDDVYLKSALFAFTLFVAFLTLLPGKLISALRQRAFKF